MNTFRKTTGQGTFLELDPGGLKLFFGGVNECKAMLSKNGKKGQWVNLSEGTLFKLFRQFWNQT